MNRCRLITLFLLFLSFTVSAQVNPTTLNVTLIQGDSVSFDLTSNSVQPVLTYAPSSGYNTEMPEGSDVYTIMYHSSEDFIGEVVFTYRSTVFSPPFFFSSELTTVFVNVIKSDVRAEDDFIQLESDEVIELSPLDNDYSNTNSLSLNAVSHVMYGSAVLTDSNTIVYTPTTEELDYIVYSVQDSLGTNDVATYYISNEVDLPESEYTTYTISNTQSQYLFMKADGFELEGSLNHGSLEQITDLVFSYTPNVDADGVESLTFEDATGSTSEFDITIFDSYIDEGVVRDDNVFTTIENEVIFNVLANDFDNSLIIDESSLSEDLVYLGNGEFSYEPPVDFTGLKSFEYTATNGFIEETGKINIAISNFIPIDEGTYDFEVKEGSVLGLTYDVPLSDYTFEVLSSPTFGTLEILNQSDTATTVCGDMIGSVSVVYTPFAGYEGIDEFDINYCPDVGTNECQLIKTKVSVVSNPDEDCNCLEDCVWSGDANNDGKVNILDLLTIGRGIGYSGNSREIEDEWAGSSAEDWDTKTHLGVNHKYADANGDGTVSDSDVDEVINNYNAVHSYAENNVLAVKDYPFLVIPHQFGVEPGELAKFDIVMGSEDFPVVDLQGVAFAINLSADFVDSSTVKLTFLEDKYLVRQSPFLNVVHQPVDGTIHAAGIRSNGTTSTGFGIIATLEFIVEEEGEGVKIPQRLRSNNGKQYVDIDVIIDDIIIEDGSGYQHTLKPNQASIEVELGDLEEIVQTPVVFPNPTASYIVVSLAPNARQIELYGMYGALIKSYSVSDINAKTIDVSNLPQGSYLVKITSSDGVTAEKFQIVR